MTMTSMKRTLLALLAAVSVLAGVIAPTPLAPSASADVYLGSEHDSDRCNGTVAGIYLPSLYTRVCFDNTTPYGPEIFTYDENNWYSWYHVVVDFNPFWTPPYVATNSPVDSFRVSTATYEPEALFAGQTYISQDMSLCNPYDGVNRNLICVDANLYQILRGMANDQSYEFAVVN